MNPDYFQSHTISLILSWIFFVPMVFGAIGGIVYLLFEKIEEGIPRTFLIWMLVCVLVFSPFRYIILQLILYEAYSIQSISAFISGLILTTYIYFIFCPLWAVGMALPGVGVIAIIGFKNTTSKTRLILASVAAPFLFLIGSFLFFNILPYAAYSTHWLKAENVIRATNGPAEYYYKYFARWEVELNRKQYGKELGLNLTSKDLLRAHVAASYLSKEQLAYYISKAYPELVKRLEKVLLEARQESPSSSSNVAKIDDETRHSIEGFFKGYDHFVSASNLLRGLLSSKDPLGDSEKAMSLLNKTKESLLECNPELLNKAYSGWGDIVSNKFIPSINIYLAGTGAKGNKNNLAKADTLIVEVGTWLENNQSELLLSLKKKYGYEIK